MSYVWYRAQLATPGVGPFHEDTPMPGFYRQAKGKGSREWKRVAIWLDKQGELVATLDDQPVSPHTVWSWCMRNPVGETVWRAVAKGAPWPDAAPEAAVAGHNLPLDDNERLKVLLAAERERIEPMLKTPVTDKETADKFSEWVLAMRRTEEEAETLRVKEKKPHDEAAKAVQSKWKPLVDGFGLLRSRLEMSVKAYLKAELDKKRAEEAAQAAKAWDQGEMPAAPEEPRTGSVARAGNTGAAITLRKVEEPVFTDYDKFLMAVKDHPTIREAAEKVASGIVRAKAPLPAGLTTRTVEK